MSQLERYDENGEPIFAVEGGPLKNLWKHLSLINNENNKEDKKEALETFDYNEFFKKLYLSRAEMDITNSVIQLLLKEVSGDISLDVIHHENQGNNGNSCDGHVGVFGLKRAFLNEISSDLKSTAEAFQENRIEEHELLTNLILKLRETYRWNLVRISSAEQVQVNLDYQEMTPIIAIDYSPMTLFKDSSSREQHNYKLSHQISGESLALIIRQKSGVLCLLFQSKLDIFDRAVVLSLKDLESNNRFEYILFEKKLSSDTIDLDSTTFGDLDKFNEKLLDARNRLICFNIIKIIANSASNFPKDDVDSTGFELNIILESKWEFNLSFTSEITENASSETPEMYKNLLREFFLSSGKDVNWSNLRSQILN